VFRKLDSRYFVISANNSAVPEFRVADFLGNAASDGDGVRHRRAVKAGGKGDGAHAVAPFARLAAMRDSIQLVTSDSSHPTARAPNLMGRGNSPRAILR